MTSSERYRDRRLPAIEDIHPIYAAGWTAGMFLSLLSSGILWGASFSWELLAFSGAVLIGLSTLGVAADDRKDRRQA